MKQKSLRPPPTTSTKTINGLQKRWLMIYFQVASSAKRGEKNGESMSNLYCIGCFIADGSMNEMI